MNTALEAEIVEPSNAIALRPQAQPALFGTTEPCEIVTKATAVADALKQVIKKQGLITNIQGKEYPRCEAWTLLGTMLGVFPVCVWTKQVEGGWEARVEARTRDGSILGAAEAQCLRGERNWSNRDDFALRSMAQTRATAKALRMPLGFVMTLAGFSPTPAEEMEGMESTKPTSKPVAPRFKEKPPEETTKTPPSPIQAPKRPHIATAEQRQRMIETIEKEGPDAVQRALGYFIEAGALLPNETMKDLPLYWVPATQGQFRELGLLIAKLNDTGKAEKPAWAKIPTNPNESAGQMPNPATAFNPEESEENPFNEPQQPELAPQQPSKAPNDDQWWRKVIVPIPHKGQKRADYLKNPDTIGSLFDARHDDEDARKRLFGFASHFEPKPWTGNDGKQRPPSKSDIDFRKALDAFADWHERNPDNDRLTGEV